MNYYIITSDKYNFLIEGYMKLFNKYCGDYHVTILGFQPPDIKLTKNFSFISLGNQNDFPHPHPATSPYPFSQSWSTPLINFFNNIEDDYFFLSFEDHFLVNEVKKELFNEALSYMEEDKNIDKVYLLKDDKKISNLYKGNFYNVVDRPNCNVTTSLLPCIWRKSYFMRLLKNDVHSPWEFEKKHNPIKLNCNVLISREVILPIVDAMRRKTFNKSSFMQRPQQPYVYGEFAQKMTQESVDVFVEMYKIWLKLK